MIERTWRGWTPPDKADAYEAFLRDDFLPSAHAIPGYRGARVLRREAGEDIEFLVITRFDSMDAIRAFAGDDPEQAHIAPPARALLSRWDERVAHYEPAFEDVAADERTLEGGA